MLDPVRFGIMMYGKVRQGIDIEKPKTVYNIGYTTFSQLNKI